MGEQRPREYGPEVVEPIQDLATSNPDWSARRVYRELKALRLVQPSWGKVASIVKDARARAQPLSDDPLLVPWSPGWPTEPEGVACLFRIRDTLSSVPVPALDGLTDRDGRWIVRLHHLFDLSRVEHCYDLVKIAQQYAGRERAQEALKRPAPRTDDLDAELRYRPWESEERFIAYDQAVARGEVPDGGLHREDLETEAEAFPARAEQWLKSLIDQIHHTRKLVEDAPDRAAMVNAQWHVEMLEVMLEEAISGPHGRALSERLTQEIQNLNPQQEDKE